MRTTKINGMVVLTNMNGEMIYAFNPKEAKDAAEALYYATLDHSKFEEALSTPLTEKEALDFLPEMTQEQIDLFVFKVD